ncbi:MAG: hypothetical protein R2759_19635 [Bacteroidales bacterium]
MSRFDIISKKERWGTTRFGKLVILLILIFMSFIFIKTIHPFLAKNAPIKTDILVVEGFITDYAVEECMTIFNAGNYSKLYITGKKRMKGAQLDMYENDGEFTAATLEKLGFDRSKIVVVAVEEDILKDRTLSRHSHCVIGWNNITHYLILTLRILGPHARRSQLLFSQAFDDLIEIGVILSRIKVMMQLAGGAAAAVSEVNKEFVAWIYARFFFYPSE